MTEEVTQSKPNILLKRKEEQDLRIYFFIGDRPNSFIPGQRPQADKRVIYVVGFKLEEAFETAKIKGEGFNLLFTAQNPTVREFLHELELESLAYEALANFKPALKVEAKKEESVKEPVKIDLSPVQMNFETFRSGLLFCANERTIIYENPEDQEVLKKIIGGLKYEPSQKYA